MIAIYQNDFDLPHASVTTAQICWMDQLGPQCIHMPGCNNNTAPKYLGSKTAVFGSGSAHQVSAGQYKCAGKALRVCFVVVKPMVNTYNQPYLKKKQQHLFKCSLMPIYGKVKVLDSSYCINASPGVYK